jgi:hypothetical protein
MKNRLVVSLYGELEEEGLALSQASWLAELEALARSIGVPLHEIAGSFKETPPTLTKGRHYDIEQFRCQFECQIKSGNVDWLEVSSYGRQDGYKTLDWEFEAFYGRDDLWGGMMLTGVNLDSVPSGRAFFPDAFVEYVVRRCESYLRPTYGFAVTMPRSFMPAGYGLGIAGEMPDELTYDTNAWSHYSNQKRRAAECDCVLRNVYGLNVLTASHLDNPVGSERLEDWIKSKPHRGHITEVGQGLFQWTFQESDDNEAFLAWDFAPVVRVREELKEHRVFLWQKVWPGLQ